MNHIVYRKIKSLPQIVSKSIISFYIPLILLAHKPAVFYVYVYVLIKPNYPHIIIFNINSTQIYFVTPQQLHQTFTHIHTYIYLRELFHTQL